MSAESELRVIAAAARAGVDAGALARRAGGADRLLRASAKRLDALGVVPGLARELAAARGCDVGEYAAELAERGIVCVARSDPAYPAPLRELADPPLAVFAMGAGAGPPPVVPGRALAIVGARRAGAPALALARRLAAFAADAGMTIVSGLALGVDAAGHLGALDVGGPTVAVLGCGPDVAYPRTNAGVHRRILETGLVLSEYPPGTPPAPWRFPARKGQALATMGKSAFLHRRQRRTRFRMPCPCGPGVVPSSLLWVGGTPPQGPGPSCCCDGCALHALDEAYRCAGGCST